MRRSSFMGVWLISGFVFVGVSLVGGLASAGGAKGATSGAVAPPPLVREKMTLSPEGLHFGMSVAEAFDFYDKVLDQDFVARYKKTQPGPQLKALDAELADQKGALRRSKIDFGTLPTGIDQTPLKGEYGYKNNESMMSLTRGDVTRYMFFSGGRLWKVYDEIALKAGGDLGVSFAEAGGALQRRFAVVGRTIAANFAQGWRFTESDWSDGTIHVRIVDRSDEKLVGLVFEDKAIAERLAAWRKTQKTDEGGIDPSVLAVTRGAGTDDPNAHAADVMTGKAHAGPAEPPNSDGGKPKKRK